MPNLTDMWRQWNVVILNPAHELLILTWVLSLMAVMQTCFYSGCVSIMLKALCHYINGWLVHLRPRVGWNFRRGQRSKGDSTAYTMLFATNNASHGHGARASVKGDIQEHKAVKYFIASTKMEPRNEKIVERGRDTTLLVASSSLCIELASSRRHVKLEMNLK